ncbi:MAG: YceI family protein [Chloroflexota bacterium]|nr:MAG: YceI family protein [Chloroflexota bacterium]
MSRIIFIFLLIALLIAGCGSQSPTESPQDIYPAPQETEPVQATQTQEQTSAEVYPPPFQTATPLVDLGSAYPAPEGETGTGTEVFIIVPGESQLSYEVGEVFLNQNNAFNLAVGRTSQVEGEIIVDRNNPANSTIGPIRADISQFSSDSQRRDNTIRERYLESSIFPIVEFTPREIQGLPDSYQEGQEITFQVSGDLTIRDVTKPVTFDVQLSGQGNEIIGEATTMILMSDFGFGPISIGGILNTEDEVKTTFTFIARK